MSAPELLRVRGLGVRYAGADQPALAGLDLDLAAGECVAVVGPSGCGKSTLCRALLDLLPPTAERTGAIWWRGDEVTADRRRWRALRGRGLGLVLQDHRHALDPVRRIGDQVEEVVGLHGRQASRAQRRDAALAALARAQLTPAPTYARRYPHELSGGQRQRANLAAALAGGPALLLADEPTTALDLPVQRDIVALLASLVRRDRLALLLVTHDRDLVPLIADRVVTLAEPVAAAPTAPAAAAAPPASRLEVRGLVVAAGGRDVVRGVDLELPAGRSVGLVGESGAGKTTLVRALAGWVTPRAGRLELRGDVPRRPTARRRAVQLVSQDAAAALDPQQSVFDAVVEAARQVSAPDDAAVRAHGLLGAVDLDVESARRRPGELSGGQRQRAQLARSLAVDPILLLADEPASSLDPDRQRRLLDLLARVRVERGLGLLLVSHDLDLLVARCDEIVVLVAGLVVERYEPARHGGPCHPFARDLLAAAPARLDRATLAPRAAPTTPQAAGPDDVVGCPYAPRCGRVEPACRRALPPLERRPDGRWLRCPPSHPCSR